MARSHAALLGTGLIGLSNTIMEISAIANQRTMETMTTNTAARSRRNSPTINWPPLAPTYPPEALQAWSLEVAEALAEGRVADAADALDNIPHAMALPWLGQVVAAVVLPDPAAWNVHDGDTRPVPAGMLVAVDLGEGC